VTGNRLILYVASQDAAEYPVTLEFPKSVDLSQDSFVRTAPEPYLIRFEIMFLNCLHIEMIYVVAIHEHFAS
jgi:hypothetical protein